MVNILVHAYNPSIWESEQEDCPEARVKASPSDKSSRSVSTTVYEGLSQTGKPCRIPSIYPEVLNEKRAVTRAILYFIS